MNDWHHHHDYVGNAHVGLLAHRHSPMEPYDHTHQLVEDDDAFHDFQTPCESVDCDSYVREIGT